MGGLTLEIAGARIRGIYMVFNPDKLSAVPRLPGIWGSRIADETN